MTEPTVHQARGPHGGQGQQPDAMAALCLQVRELQKMAQRLQTELAAHEAALAKLDAQVADAIDPLPTAWREEGGGDPHRMPMSGPRCKRVDAVNRLGLPELRRTLSDARRALLAGLELCGYTWMN